MKYLYDGMENEIAALILNIYISDLKEVSSTFKLEKLLYNNYGINALLFQNYSQFFLQPINPKIIRYNRRIPSSD